MIINLRLFILLLEDFKLFFIELNIKNNNVNNFKRLNKSSINLRTYRIN